MVRQWVLFNLASTDRKGKQKETERGGQRLQRAGRKYATRLT